MILHVNGLRMFYKPNFCCGCGEKIQRSEWGILTSRRFCDVCAIENQGHEWMQRVAVVLAFLVGLFGFGSYLKSGMMFAPAALNRPEQISVPVSETSLKPSRRTVPEESRILGSPGISSEDQTLRLNSGPRAPTKEQPARQTIASDGPVYYCGAMTKKGKPCARRVKTKGRCWQHVGQPSALASHTSTDVY